MEIQILEWELERQTPTVFLQNLHCILEVRLIIYC